MNERDPARRSTGRLTKAMMVVLFLVNSWPLPLALSPMVLMPLTGHEYADTRGYLQNIFSLLLIDGYPLVYFGCLYGAWQENRRGNLRTALRLALIPLVMATVLLAIVFPYL